jgi:6-phosphogluconolactonase (cycloisomerase 2 family)
MRNARNFLAVGMLLVMSAALTGCGHPGCQTATPGGGSASSGGVSAGSAGAPSGCQLAGGGLSNSTMQTAFLYFMDDSAGEIGAEALNANNSNTFAPLGGFVPPPALGKVTDGGMVVVNKKYLYVPIAGFTASLAPFSSVYGYSIDPTTGALTAVPNTSYPVSGLQVGTTFSIAADPGGKFLFIGDSSGITVFAINATDGSLTPVNNGTPYASGIGAPQQMTTDGMGKYLYALDGKSIAEFSYSAAGTLTPIAVLTSSVSNMSMLTPDPTGKYMLGITGNVGGNGGLLDFNVYVFTIAQSTGTPGSLGGPTPFSTTLTPAYVQISPSGGFVYTFNRNDLSTTGTLREPIIEFSFDPASGALTNPQTFSDVLSDMGKFDQSGNFIFAIGQESSATAAGMIPISVSKTGVLSTSIAHAGVPGTSFVVTDEP